MSRRSYWGMLGLVLGLLLAACSDNPFATLAELEGTWAYESGPGGVMTQFLIKDGKFHVLMRSGSYCERNVRIEGNKFVLDETNSGTCRFVAESIEVERPEPDVLVLKLGGDKPSVYRRTSRGGSTTTPRSPGSYHHPALEGNEE